MLLPFALPKTCPLHRQCTALVSNANYRKKVLEDRSRSLKSMHLPHERHQRGAEVSNQDPLPKAASSRLAADAQLWCEFNSWQVCSGCHRIIPRQLTPEGLQSLQDPECRPQTCIFCKSKSVVPQTLAPPIALQNLPSKVLEALRPLEACFGPEIHARNHWGGTEGYRLHSCMVSFSWCSEPVKTKVAALPSSERTQANNALQWLRQNSGKSKEESAYWSFYQEQSNFFQKNPAPEERQLKRHLRFIETEGLECALWRHVFHQRQQCLTWTRNQSATRIAHAAPCQHTKNQRLPASNLIGAEEESEVADEEQQENQEKTVGVRRAYQALMLSPWLDASMSYELTHFTYDLVIWTDVGPKRNLRTNIPMRLMLKGHSFSPEYWRDMHRALIDLTKQKGYPQVFSTVSPYEWSWPYHCFIPDAMQKAHRGKT